MASLQQNEHPGNSLILAAEELAKAVSGLSFGPPVSHIYNPLTYAWQGYASYIRKYATTRKRVVFLGMNPGPFGMVQTGVPFGDVASVKGWLGIYARIVPPDGVHPRRPVLGFECPRCEISGQRLWGFFQKRFGTANRFFADHLVINYCPLAFVESTGRNRTPDKLTAPEREALYRRCDLHLQRVVMALRPQWVVGIGGFAADRAVEVLKGVDCQLGKVLHPSPASPLANRNWGKTVEEQLRELGVWR